MNIVEYQDQIQSIHNQPETQIAWPCKLNLFGVQVSRTTYAQAVDAALEAARGRVPATISCHAAHAIVTASNDPRLRAKVNRFEMITPDGQPVCWALNSLYDAGLKERVYGPELMLRLCAAAARQEVSIYLYGGTPNSLAKLEASLIKRFPGLMIAGSEAPPFRPLTSEEDEAAVTRINTSGAGLLFIGLGCPKQDHFAADHADRIQAVQVCVGAAFDLHAGVTSMAPSWMQRHGFEWIYRFCAEPRRLWRRYLVTNTQFLAKWCGAFAVRLLKGEKHSHPNSTFQASTAQSL